MSSPGWSASGTLGLRPIPSVLPLPAHRRGEGWGEGRELRKREQNSRFAANNGVGLFGDGAPKKWPFGQPKRDMGPPPEGGRFANFHFPFVIFHRWHLIYCFFSFLLPSEVGPSGFDRCRKDPAQLLVFVDDFRQ